jgi:predicted helicase
MAVRESFKTLLERMGSVNKWTLVVEQKIEGLARVVRPDGTMRDANTLPRGYWEAKDSADNLDAEIVRKFERGYPRSNIIFEDTRRAVLYQGGERAGEYDLMLPEQVATLMTRFLSYTEPNIEGFEQAVERFRHDTPELAKGLLELIDGAHKNNRRFKDAYDDFYALCQTALNPNISRDAVDEMLIQHMLTERLMRTVFDNPDFSRRNAIAAEVEEVIEALTSQSFSRRDFLGQLDYFYEAIEAAARELRGFSEKQAFINTVYERFFQGYAVKVADTHGIVYTPQPIVDFMSAAVEEVLRDEFDLALHDEDVCIIDPCTGTGNFIINLLHRLHRQNPAALKDVYKERLFANEVMLLPYYVSSLNIEHAYYDLTREYAPFEGLCFVDTLDLAEGVQPRLAFMTEKNTQRVERQKQAPITVIIGNPPYNVGQVNENDNNKNRVYEVIDQRVSETYARDSKATLRAQLYDPYVKFFRWASDRLGERDGVVCFVSNNGFVDGIAFDGMRKHLLQDFTRVYHLDLHGNVRQNPKLSGTTHNVFGIQVGVGITVAVRSSQHSERRLYYHRVPEFWRKEEKLAYLTRMVELEGKHNSLNTVAWQELKPDARHTWLVPTHAEEFETFMPMGSKEAKRAAGRNIEVIFRSYSNGVKTNSDNYLYDFSSQALFARCQRIVDDYRAQLGRWFIEGQPKQLEGFLKVDETVHKWIRNTKRTLLRGTKVQFDESKIRLSLYRPFTKRYYYFERAFNEDIYQFPRIFPTPGTEQENRVIWLKVGSEWPMFALMTNSIVDLLPQGGSQCFPFYSYDEDGSNRRENITDWALGQFRGRYGDEGISKWDIFYTVYALLHHPVYRQRYGDNLKRDLPRIPYVEDFGAMAQAGRQLAELHLNYESVEPYPLECKLHTG